jgi:hypothetical protein
MKFIFVKAEKFTDFRGFTSKNLNYRNVRELVSIKEKKKNNFVNKNCYNYLKNKVYVLLLPCQADARKRKRKRETEVHTARGQGETTALKIHQISACNTERAFDLLKGQCHEMV